jgi:hypothetical protein
MLVLLVLDIGLFANLNNLEMFRTQFGVKFILKVLPKYAFTKNSP